MSNTSNLDTASQRFLSSCLQQALADDWLNAEDVFREFPPPDVMLALEGAPDLRAKVLVEAAGVHARIAPKKSTNAAAEDLQIALDEGVCSFDHLLELFGADEQVRHLEASRIWGRLTRDEFWCQDDARARSRMLATIEFGLEQELLDLPRLIRAVGPTRLAADLPKELVEQALCAAVEAGLAGEPLSPEKLLHEVPLEQWVEHVPLVHLWQAAVVGEIAVSAGLADAKPAPAEPAAPAEAKAKPRSKTKRGAAPPPANESETATPEERKARQGAIDNLNKLGRLPKSADELPTPLLLAIDAMYADLQSLTDDDDRAACIHDSFPNQAMLKDALFALAETLDPRLDQASLQKREASIESLVQLVLFEERRRQSRSTSSPPPSVREGSVPPPPPSGVAARGPSVPPPLPPGAGKASTPPPPLPPQARKN